MPNKRSNPTTTKYANSKFISGYLTNVSNSYYLNIKTLLNVKGFIAIATFFQHGQAASNGAWSGTGQT